MRSPLVRLMICGALLLLLLGLGRAWADTEVRSARDAYRAAEKLLDKDRYEEAADAFRQVYEEHSDSRYAARSLYWQAFALSREGSLQDLKKAMAALQLQNREFPDEAHRGDSGELAVYIRERLAERGDAKSAREIAELADDLENNVSPSSDAGGYSDEAKLQALHALMQLKPERALPILRRILVEDAENQPRELREQALALLPQLDSPEAAEILVHVARNEKSEELREAAVFWLSQTDGEGAVDILREILEDSSQPEEIRGQAVFALSQIGGPEVIKTMREIALNDDTPEEVREQAIHWMAQTGAAKDLDFMRQLYHSLDNDELRGQVLFAVSQGGGKGAAEWMLDVARDENTDIDTRTQALFWAAQSGSVDAATYVKIFDEVDNEDLRGQVVFGLSQMGTTEAVEAMIHIAKTAEDQDLKDQALFWLGQTDDERAVDFLLEVIGGDQ